MKIRLETLIVTVFLLGSIGMFVWFSTSKPHVLILQSYDKEYSWVKDVNTGLKRVLDKHRDLAIRWYYLDTKRHPTIEFKTNAGTRARRMIDDSPPDVIVAIDDDAQQFVTRHYLNHPTIKIVFAGVNNEPAAYGFDKATNVTGILERLPLAALKETLQIAAQRNNLQTPLRIQFIGDTSETVLGDEKFFRKYNWAPFRILDSKLLNTFDEWKQAVRDSAGQVDFLINSNYRKIRRNANEPGMVPPGELIAWTEKNSPVPVIGANAFFAEDGGMLAIGTSPYEQGEVAAKLALEILDHNKRPDRLPFQITDQFVVAMRESLMQARHFDLPQVYEASARASNKFYE
ncbi:MAG TPA: hypothetical protein VJ001_17865 [Rhodocyclaceae bacterium]|nr:hypothetical protein [Rhodocyclaceae bacterium]